MWYFSDVLERGGRAMDAAIAVLFSTDVVHSQSSGLGGGFVMTVYIKGEGAYSVMAREVAPEKATQDMYVGTKGKSLRGISKYCSLYIYITRYICGPFRSPGYGCSWTTAWIC